MASLDGRDPSRSVEIAYSDCASTLFGQGKASWRCSKEASTRPFQPSETSETPLDAFRLSASVLQDASKLESQIWPSRRTAALLRDRAIAQRFDKSAAPAQRHSECELQRGRSGHVIKDRT